jgi:hypothetical protein
MFKNVLIGVLTITILGALAVAIYDGAKVKRTEAQGSATPVPGPSQASGQVGGYGQGNQAGTGTGPQVNSLDNVGDAWTAQGTIASVDAFGFELTLADGSLVYVELGPPTFWQAQGVALFADETVIVDGFSNQEQYHARLVTKADGSQLELRTTTGQPLWSGGTSGGQAQVGNTTGQSQVGGTTGQGQQAQGAGQGVGQVNVQPEEWVTLEGQVTAVAQNSLTVQTGDGQTLTIQLGRPGFAAQQGASFTVGDAVSLLGFWQYGQFQAGEITQAATGARLMLRDPNGRPLWSGPGRSGNTNGQGQSQDQGQPQGQNSGNGGQGRGYRGGRG